MEYNKVKSKLQEKYRKGDITQKQYFRLVSEARAKYLVNKPIKDKPVADLDNPDGLLEIFDGNI